MQYYLRSLHSERVNSRKRILSAVINKGKLKNWEARESGGFEIERQHFTRDFPLLKSPVGSPRTAVPTCVYRRREAE